MLLLCSVGAAEYHMFGKEMFVWFIMCVYLERLSICVCFPFWFEAGMWDLIVLIPDHCFSIYFTLFLIFSKL